MATRGYLSKRSRKLNSSSQKSSVKNQRKKKLPPWDGTVSNLLIHKPTKEELRRRHELHQPVQRYSESSVGESSGSKLETFKTPENMKNARYSVLREIMNTNEKLQEALTYSDKKMSAVPDLFGDDPKRYRGFPNVTCAPGHKAENPSETVRKLAFMKEPSVGASHLDVLSESIMDETALNNLSELQQKTSEYDENNNERNLLSNGQCEQNFPPSTMGNSCALPTTANGLPTYSEGKTCKPEKCDLQSEAKIFPERKIHKENKDKKASDKQPPKPPTLKGLYDLRETVDNLEEEIRMFEQETGREQTSMSFATKEKESFGGFTTSILHAIIKLVGYLRDCERQRKTESTLKQDLFLTLQQQQMLIDALISEVISLQEENRKLQEDVESSKETTGEQIKLIKRELYAVLKAREYEILSRDMDFLYDRQTSETGVSQESLQDVIRSHGNRDNFEYVTATKEAEPRTSGEDYTVKTNAVTNKETANQETTPKAFQTKSPTNSMTSSTGNPHASQITEPPGRISQVDEQEKTSEHLYLNSQPPLDSITVPHDTNTSANNLEAHETDSAAGNTEFSSKNDQLFHSEEQHGKYDTPCGTSPATPEVFTYYNPAPTNTFRNKNPTLPSSSDKYFHEDLQQESVFIGRNQTTSPHRHGTKQGEESANSILQTDESRTGNENPPGESPGVSPVLFDRRILPERPGQERVVVRLPSMWQDYDTGMQRSTPGTNTTKQAVRQKSENGWFALSSHVDSR